MDLSSINASESKPPQSNFSTRGSERIQIEAACAIVGVCERTMQGLALRGEMPGAAKIGGRWTFNERVLRAHVRAEEERVCQRKREAGSLVPPRTGASGATTDGMGGSKSMGESIAGAYEQLIQSRRKRSATKTSSRKKRRSGTAR